MSGTSNDQNMTTLSACDQLRAAIEQNSLENVENVIARHSVKCFSNSSFLKALDIGNRDVLNVIITKLHMVGPFGSTPSIMAIMKRIRTSEQAELFFDLFPVEKHDIISFSYGRRVFYEIFRSQMDVENPDLFLCIVKRANITINDIRCAEHLFVEVLFMQKDDEKCFKFMKIFCEALKYEKKDYRNHNAYFLLAAIRRELLPAIKYIVEKGEFKKEEFQRWSDCTIITDKRIPRDANVQRYVIDELKVNLHSAYHFSLWHIIIFYHKNGSDNRALEYIRSKIRFDRRLLGVDNIYDDVINTGCLALVKKFVTELKLGGHDFKPFKIDTRHGIKHLIPTLRYLAQHVGLSCVHFENYKEDIIKQCINDNNTEMLAYFMCYLNYSPRDLYGMVSSSNKRQKIVDAHPVPTTTHQDVSVNETNNGCSSSSSSMNYHGVPATTSSSYAIYKNQYILQTNTPIKR